MIESLTAMGVDGIITNDPGSSADDAGRRAVVRWIGAGEAPVAAAVGSAPAASTVAPRRHWKSTTPRSVTRLAGYGLQFEAAAALARGGAGPTSTKAKSSRSKDPPSASSRSCTAAGSSCTSCRGVPVAGHRAADADRVGLVGGVADIDRRPEFAGAQKRMRRRCRSRRPRRSAAAASRAPAGQTARLWYPPLLRTRPSPRPTPPPRPASAGRYDHPREASDGARPRASGCGIPGRGGSTLRGVVELLARVPVFSTLEPDDLERIAQVSVPRHSSRDRRCSARATRVIPVTWFARARARRAKPRRRPHDHARDIRTWRHFRRARDVRGRAAVRDRRGGRGESVIGVLGPDMRRLMGEHPRSPHGWLSRLGDGCARPTSGSHGSPSRPCRAASRSCSASSSSRQSPRARNRQKVLVTATQADLAQLAGSSRESASRCLAVFERAGVISQGRGRLVVHDPKALKQYVF